MNQQSPLQVKLDDETMKGRYANMVQIAHNHDEFVIDFLNVFPPGGICVGRMIISPTHAKRLLQAIGDNVKRYEDSFGEIKIDKDSGLSKIEMMPKIIK